MAENQAPQTVGTISTEQAGRLLMISGERVRQLIKAGYIGRAADGRLLLVAAVQGYIRFLKDEERRSSRSATASRLQEAKAEEVRIRVAERNRELIPIEDAEAALDGVLATVRSELAGLPARVTRDIPLRRTIERELNDALDRMADALDAASTSARTGVDAPAAGADPDPGRMGEAEPAVSADKRPARAARAKPDALRNPDRPRRSKRRVPADRGGDGRPDGQDGPGA